MKYKIGDKLLCIKEYYSGHITYHNKDCFYIVLHISVIKNDEFNSLNHVLLSCEKNDNINYLSWYLNLKKTTRILSDYFITQKEYRKRKLLKLDLI